MDFVYALAVVSLICLGWLLSSFFGDSSGLAFMGALGGLIGGLGAIAAAYAAYYVAKRQELRDRYILKVFVRPSENIADGIDLGMFTREDLFDHTLVGFVVIEAFNEGLRPIQICALNYKSEKTSGVIEFDSFVIEPGRKASKKVSQKITLLHSPDYTEFASSCYLYACDLEVEDAAGFTHKVEVKTAPDPFIK